MVEYHGELSTLGWMRFDSAAYPVAGIEIPLQQDEVYIGAVFTRTNLRGRGGVTTGSVEQLKWLRARGITKAYAWIRTANRPMLRTVQRIGWNVKVQVLQYYVSFGIRIPVVNVVTVADPADPLAAWCSRKRMSFRSGLRIDRQGEIAMPAAPRRPGRRPEEPDTGQ
jgi:hypothetical protein